MPRLSVVHPASVVTSRTRLTGQAMSRTHLLSDGLSALMSPATCSARSSGISRCRTALPVRAQRIRHERHTICIPAFTYPNGYKMFANDPN